MAGDQGVGHTMSGSMTIELGAITEDGVVGHAFPEHPGTSSTAAWPGSTHVAGSDLGTMALTMLCAAFLLGTFALLRRASATLWSKRLGASAMRIRRRSTEVLAALRPPTPQTLCISRT